MVDPALDCKHYLGDRPCKYGKLCRCDNYAPMGHRVAIIKLGALGDVVRTVSLLKTIKRQWPVSHITWVSKPNGLRILVGHPLIDNLIEFNAENSLVLAAQKFDLVLSLDKEPAPTSFCKALDCEDKRGITISEFGTAMPINESCREYFALGLDDDAKFHKNVKSYPQLIHDALDLPYIREPYQLYPAKADFDRADEIMGGFTKAAAGRAVIGLNTGSGDVFANKAPSARHWLEIGSALLKKDYRIALLGGPAEKELNMRLAGEFGLLALNTGSDNSERTFTAIVDRCDAVIAGDTLAMHVAIARRRPVVALFGPTCHQEIDLFQLGVKLVSSAACGPCYKRSCSQSPSCMDMISTGSIVAAVESVLKMAPEKQSNQRSSHAVAAT